MKTQTQTQTANAGFNATAFSFKNGKGRSVSAVDFDGGLILRHSGSRSALSGRPENHEVFLSNLKCFAAGCDVYVVPNAKKFLEAAQGRWPTEAECKAEAVARFVISPEGKVQAL